MPLNTLPPLGLELFAILAGIFSVFRSGTAPKKRHSSETKALVPESEPQSSSVVPIGVVSNSSDSQAREPIPASQELPDRRPALRILVAEDNPVNRRVMELMLRRMGYAADIAVDGQQAVEMAANKLYDAILMDLHMPRMGGIEATQMIVSRCQGSCPRVVAVTADVTPEARKACENVGMAAYLTKPLDSGLLLHELQQAERCRSLRPTG